GWSPARRCVDGLPSVRCGAPHSCSGSPWTSSGDPPASRRRPGAIPGQASEQRRLPVLAACLFRTLQCQVRPTIPPVAGLVVLRAYGTLLAITGHRERILHAQRLQVAPGLQGTLLAQHEVAFPAAALVAAVPAWWGRRTGCSLSLARAFRGRQHVLLGTAAQGQDPDQPDHHRPLEVL